MSERICARLECDSVLDRKHSRFCCEDCRQQGSGIIVRNGFTSEMIAELYEDAKAGRIAVWEESLPR